jgi:hypothetical protein
MAYVMCMGNCITCGMIFIFNPHRVPSIRINGLREPVCLACVTAANPIRVADGLDPIVPHPEAYNAEPDGDGDLYGAVGAVDDGD